MGPGWNGAFPWYEPFLWLGNFAMAKAGNGSQVLNVFAHMGHMPLLLTFSCLSRSHGQLQGLWVEKHASLMGCTVSHTRTARDVYYCYRKGELLAGRRDVIHHSIPSPFYKWPKQNQSSKYFIQNHTASECQRQDVNSVLCDCTFHLFIIYHVNIYDALCQ